MRELKFRTFFLDNGEMTKPWTIYDVSKKLDPNFDFLRKEPFMAGTGGSAVGRIYIVDERSHVIMQYTGLKDKAGLEIFEGDIISYNRNNMLSLKESGKIIFRDFSFMIRHFNYLVDTEHESETNEYHFDYHPLHLDYIENIEVIGNIHEHPELITTKEEK